MRTVLKGIERKEEKIRQWYIARIEAEVERAGGMASLSRALGRDDSYVAVVLRRGNIISLRETVRQIMERW